MNTEDLAIDLNAKQRYATLLAIQYDFQEIDKELIRYLFAQEIDSLINDDTSGTTYSLWLGAYLLASYRDPLDIPSFYKAKNIDMDTHGGFDTEFMYWALKTETHDYVRTHFPDLYKKIQDDTESEEFYECLDSWWANRCSEHPAHPADENDYALYERHLYFGDLKQARKHIDNWARDRRDEREVSVTLEYAYKALGAYREVIKILEVNLSQAKTDRDKIIIISDLLQMYAALNSPPEAFAYFAQADAELSTFQNWKSVGLGKMLVHAAFEYAALCDDDQIAVSSCGFALSWCQELTSHHYTLLVAGEKATRRCQLISLAEDFRHKAETERQRIDALFRK
ncbi:hypothetical protein ACO0LL_27810 [Undibacterium sp. TC4M20W]